MNSSVLVPVLQPKRLTVWNDCVPVLQPDSVFVKDLIGSSVSGDVPVLQPRCSSCTGIKISQSGVCVPVLQLCVPVLQPCVPVLQPCIPALQPGVPVLQLKRHLPSSIATLRSSIAAKAPRIPVLQPRTFPIDLFFALCVPVLQPIYITL